MAVKDIILLINIMTKPLRGLEDLCIEEVADGFFYTATNDEQKKKLKKFEDDLNKKLNRSVVYVVLRGTDVTCVYRDLKKALKFGKENGLRVVETVLWN